MMVLQIHMNISFKDPVSLPFKSLPFSPNLILMNNTLQIHNLKVTKKALQIKFSPNLSLSALPNKPFSSSLPLSPSPLPPLPKLQRHRNQSLPEKKGQNGTLG